MMTHWSRQIILGGVAWLALAGLALPGWVDIGLIEQLFLLAPLVIVPLGLALVDLPHRIEAEHLYGFIQLIQPICAAMAIAAFLIPPGPLAGMLAAGWLVLTGLTALLGVTRFLSRKNLKATAIGLDAGLVYLFIGGGWLVMARLGLNPLGFGDVIVLLTAVHFHYAGFAAPILASLSGQALSPAPDPLRKWHQISVFGIIAGTPLVAAGITFWPLLELAGALIMAASLSILLYLIRFIVLHRVTQRPVQLLLTVAGFSLIVGLLLIVVYAVTQFTGQAVITIPQMARYHGVANALGFALCGLLAWNILEHKQPNESD